MLIYYMAVPMYSVHGWTGCLGKISSWFYSNDRFHPWFGLTDHLPMLYKSFNWKERKMQNFNIPPIFLGNILYCAALFCITPPFCRFHPWFGLTDQLPMLYKSFNWKERKMQNFNIRSIFLGTSCIVPPCFVFHRLFAVVTRIAVKFLNTICVVCFLNEPPLKLSCPKMTKVIHLSQKIRVRMHAV